MAATTCYALQVAQDLFIATLAVLTAVCGCALLALLWRRRRQLTAERREEREQAAEDASVAALDSKESGTRPIDDYALPISFERAHKTSEEDDDIGKICPACGSRYGSHFRYCERDNSELAALN